MDSALAQTYPNLEVIVVDDNSPDSSPEILRSYGDRIRLTLNTENRGTYGVLDQALEMATGEFVAVLNSDDVWAPEKIEKQMAGIGDCVLSYTGGMFIDSDGEEIVKNPMGWPMPTSLPEHHFAQLIRNNYIVASSALLRTDVARRVGGFDDGFKNIGDWNMWLKMAEQGCFAFTPGLLVKYRIHGSNAIDNMAITAGETVELRTKWAEKCDGRSDSGFPTALALSWAAIGRSHAAAGRSGDARRAFVRAIRLQPIRLKTYLRYFSTFFVRAGSA